MIEYKVWQTEWIEAYLWVSVRSDDTCFPKRWRTQPRIDYLSPNRRVGYPRTNRRNLWAGTFEPYGQGAKAQEIEIKQAADRFGIQLGEYYDRLGPYGYCLFAQNQ